MTAQKISVKPSLSEPSSPQACTISFLVWHARSAEIVLRHHDQIWESACICWDKADSRCEKACARRWWDKHSWYARARLLGKIVEHWQMLLSESKPCSNAVEYGWLWHLQGALCWPRALRVLSQCPQGAPTSRRAFCRETWEGTAGRQAKRPGAVTGPLQLINSIWRHAGSLVSRITFQALKHFLVRGGQLFLRRLRLVSW